MTPAKPQPPKKATVPGVAKFRADPLFPKIERAVASILVKGKVVAPVDVLVEMQLLTPDRLKDWRCGQVPYLERVISCNLTRLSRLLRILRFHAHDSGLGLAAFAASRQGEQPLHRSHALVAFGGQSKNNG